MKSDQRSDAVLKSALPTVHQMQETTKDTSAPVVWVDGTGRSDLRELIRRLVTIGTSTRVSMRLIRTLARALAFLTYTTGYPVARSGRNTGEEFTSSEVV